jgi:hypothetical protein
MPRPKLAAEKQHRVISVSLSPEALARLENYQAQYRAAHQRRLSRSQAVETLILQGGLPASTEEAGLTRG